MTEHQRSISTFKVTYPNPTRDELETFAWSFGKISDHSDRNAFRRLAKIGSAIEAAFPEFDAEGPLEEVDNAGRSTGIWSLAVTRKTDWMGVAEVDDYGLNPFSE